MTRSTSLTKPEENAILGEQQRFGLLTAIGARYL
jgi:hypothetical protein